MNIQEEKISQDILVQIQDFASYKFSHRDSLRKLISIVENIASQCGTSDYLFVLMSTRLCENISSTHRDLLYELLDAKVLGSNIISYDGAFCGYFTLGVYFARINDFSALQALIKDEDYHTMFANKYILYLDALCRYLSQIEAYDTYFLLGNYLVHSLTAQQTLSEKQRTLPNGLVQAFNPIAQKVTVLSAISSILYTANQQGRKITSSTATANSFDFDKMQYSDIDILINKPFDISILNKDLIAIANNYADQAIEYNPAYSKYYYLKAKILFESYIVFGRAVTAKNKSACLELMNTAVDKENTNAHNSQARINEYKSYIQRITEYTDSNTHNINFDDYDRQKLTICRATDVIPHEQRPAGKGDINMGDYVMISYSSRDYMQVYCDIIEMTKNKVGIWYDANTIPGEKWDDVVEKAIEKCSCVICYISDNYFSSPAVAKELELIKKYNKTVITVDLSKSYSTTNIIYHIIKNNQNYAKFSAVFNTEYMIAVSELFHKDIDIIERDKDPMAITHVARICDCLKNKHPEVFDNTIAEAQTVINNKYVNGYKKPNEDYYVCDNEYDIYAVADGITTNAHNYSEGMQKSIATEIAIIFCEGITANIRKNLSLCNTVADVKNLLISAFRQVTIAVKQRVKKADYTMVNDELPGCVGVVGVIYKDNFVYISFGDCMNILVRNNARIMLNQRQTIYAFEKAKVETDRRLLSHQYVNNANNEYGYCVMNGDSNAHKLLDVASIKLEKNDIIYMISDGLSDYVENSRLLLTSNLSTQQIIENSNMQEDNRGIVNRDDKTIIKIRYVS